MQSTKISCGRCFLPQQTLRIDFAGDCGDYLNFIFWDIVHRCLSDALKLVTAKDNLTEDGGI